MRWSIGLLLVATGCGGKTEAVSSRDFAHAGSGGQSTTASGSGGASGDATGGASGGAPATGGFGGGVVVIPEEDWGTIVNLPCMGTSYELVADAVEQPGQFSFVLTSDIPEVAWDDLTVLARAADGAYVLVFTVDPDSAACKQGFQLIDEGTLALCRGTCADYLAGHYAAPALLLGCS